MAIIDEYEVMVGSPADIQLELNQWKHEYEIEVLGGPILTSATDDDIIVLVKRTPLTKRKISD